jgi:hypothetical protein
MIEILPRMVKRKGMAKDIKAPGRAVGRHKPFLNVWPLAISSCISVGQFRPLQE